MFKNTKQVAMEASRSIWRSPTINNINCRFSKDQEVYERESLKNSFSAKCLDCVFFQVFHVNVFFM
ncbi:hypothetical protein Peur_020640 [Populus x canadensis]